MSPAGVLALLGPRDGFLWLVNSQGQPMALQLSHPGLSAMSLVAAGDVTGESKRVTYWHMYYWHMYNRTYHRISHRIIYSYHTHHTHHT